MSEYSYRAGDPHLLAPGPIYLGDVWDLFGNQFEVTVSPGHIQGLIYYSLQPTGSNRITDPFDRGFKPIFGPLPFLNPAIP